MRLPSSTKTHTTENETLELGPLNQCHGCLLSQYFPPVHSSQVDLSQNRFRVILSCSSSCYDHTNKGPEQEKKKRWLSLAKQQPPPRGQKRSKTRRETINTTEQYNQKQVRLPHQVRSKKKRIKKKKNLFTQRTKFIKHPESEDRIINGQTNTDNYGTEQNRTEQNRPKQRNSGGRISQ